MWHSDQLVSLSRISRVGSTPATPCAARNASKSRTSASRDGDLLSQRTNESAVATVSSDTEANALAIVEASSGSDKASASAARKFFIMVRDFPAQGPGGGPPRTFCSKLATRASYEKM